MEAATTQGDHLLGDRHERLGRLQRLLHRVGLTAGGLESDTVAGSLMLVKM